MKTVLLPLAVRFVKYNLFYGKSLALKNINLDIPQNKVTALIGPPACGKSSILRAVNRGNDFIYDSKGEGEIYIGEECITEPGFNRLYLNRRVALLSSNNTILPGTVLDNLLHYLRINRKCVFKNGLIEYIEKHLEPLGIWTDFKDCLQKNAFILLGGPRRLLALAQLILAEPEILLLDEPTIRLDRVHTLRLEEIVPLLRGKMTTIIATRNNRQAASLSDFTAFIYQGELVETGETMKFFSRPSQRRTEDYLSGHSGYKSDKH